MKKTNTNGRILAWILSIAMVVSLMPTFALADETGISDIANAQEVAVSESAADDASDISEDSDVSEDVLEEITEADEAEEPNTDADAALEEEDTEFSTSEADEDSEDDADDLSVQAVTTVAELLQAVSEAEPGQTIVLSDDIVLDESLNIDKALTLDLNGYTIKCVTVNKNEAGKYIKGKICVYGTSTEDEVIIQNGKIVAENSESDGDRNTTPLIVGKSKKPVKLNINNVTIECGNTTERFNAGGIEAGYGSEVNLAEDSKVISSGNADGISVWDDDTVVNIYGTVYAENYLAVDTNGTKPNNNTINIYDGAEVKSDNGVGIYFPCSGELNIFGGTIAGQTAIYQAGGTVLIQGGYIYATGDTAELDNDYTGGTFATGEAVVVHNRGGAYGTPTILISAGTIISANANAVGSYAKEGEERLEGFVSGGSFSGDVSEFFVDGKTVIKNSMSGLWQVDDLRIVTEISSVEDLEMLRVSVNSGLDYSDQTVTLTNNINMDSMNIGGETNWTPIGTEENPFTGKFDGRGNEISGIYMNEDDESQNLGLFGYVSGGAIDALTVSGNIVGGSNIGGIAGSTKNTSVTNCVNKVNIIGSGNIGGIIGKAEDGCLIARSANTAAISGSGENIGGIAGSAGADSAVENSYNIGTIMAFADASYIGGIVGYAGENTKLSNSYSYAGIYDGGSDIGGIVGYSGGEIENCYYNMSAYNSSSQTDTDAGKTVEQFASGEVAHLLQNGPGEQIWGQTLGNYGDDYPVFANYENKVVKVSFVVEGDDDYMTVYLNSGNTVNMPKLEDSDTKTFVGWTIDNSADGELFDGNAPVEEDIVLRAVGTEKFSVKEGEKKIETVYGVGAVKDLSEYAESAEGGELQYAITGGNEELGAVISLDTELAIAKDAAAGTYTLKIEVSTGRTLFALSREAVSVKEFEVVVVISKADSEISTAPAAVDGLVYNTKEQSLVTAGEAKGGELVYSLTEDGTYTEEIPVGTAAKEYVVYYKAAENENYNATKPQSIKVNIAKADPVYTVPTGLSATYGDKLGDVTLPAGWTWDSGNSTGVGNAGSRTIAATYTPDDTDNYNIISGIEVTVAVAKANPAYTVPTGLSATYGDKLGDVALPAGWTWDSGSSTSVGSVGDRAFNITYTPNDTNNYNIISGIEVTVAVAKADPAYTVPMGLSATYGDKLGDVALPAGWTWDSGSSTSVGDAGRNTFAATFTPDDTDSYNIIYRELTVDVAQKASEFEVPTGLSATYGDKLGDVTLPADANGKFSWNSGNDASVGLAGSNTFIVTYTPNDAKNYTTVKDIRVTVAVAKADPVYTVPTGLSATYGDKLSDIVLPAGWKWTNEAASAGTVGTREFAAVYTPIDTRNYNTVDMNLAVEVKKAVPSYKVPLNLKASYGGKLGDIELPAEDGVGHFTWNEPDTEFTALGDLTFTATFTPVDTDNYTTPNDIEINVKVEKADPKVTAPRARVLNYTGEAQQLIIAGETDYGVMEYSFDGENYSTQIPSGMAAGPYTVYYRINEGEYYNGVAQTPIVIVIAPVDMNVTAPQVNSLTYTGEAQQLITAGSVEGGTIEYALGTGDYGAGIPTAVNADRYVVKYRITADANHNKSVIEGSVEVVINKAVPTVTAPEGLTAVYGSTLTDVKFADNAWSWKDESVSVGGAGERAHTAVYAPADENYTSIEMNVAVTVTKAVPAVTMPEGLAAVYGDTLADVELPEGFAWTDSRVSVGGAGEQTHTAVFTPNDTDNYAAKAVQIVITVAKAVPVVTAPRDITAVYGDTLADVELPEGFAWINSEESTGAAGVHEFDAVYTHEDTDNYNSVSIKISVAVEKAEPSVPEIGDVTATVGQTLADIELPEGFAWADAALGVGAVGENEFDAVYTPADTDNYNTAQVKVTVTVVTVAEAIPGVVIDFENEALTGFEKDAEYTIAIADGEEPEAVKVVSEDGTISVGGYIGKTISIIKKGDGQTTHDSDAQTLEIPSRAAAPSSVTGGTLVIGGLTTEMEYKSPSAETWTAAQNSSAAVSAGTYEVRIKATESSFAGETVTVTAAASGSSGGSGGGGGGGGSVRPPAPVVDDPNVDDPNAPVNIDDPNVPLAGALPFDDVDDKDWFYESVEYVYDAGLMNGTSDNIFDPDVTTTRAMIVTILYRYEGEPEAALSSFDDVDESQYYAKAIGWASANNIVRGYDDVTYGPNDSITREQLASILYRYCDYKEGYDVSAYTELDSYTDTNKISDYAAGAFAWAVADGIITGVTDNTLEPSGQATRAQVATMLMRLMMLASSEK